MTNNIHPQPSHSRKPQRLRWSWLPSLMFGDGMMLSVIILMMMMMRRFGLNNTHITLYTSLLCALLTLRPLFERIVTHFNGTTKVWILSAEFISAMSLWATAFILPSSYWLEGTICFMPFAILSAIFHNIAVDRFYLHTSPTTSTSHPSRIATLFRLLALLFGAGAVAMLAGNMEVLTRSVRYPWSFAFYVMAGIQFFLWLWHSIFLPGGEHPQNIDKDLYGLHRGEYHVAIDSVLHGIRNRVSLYFFLLFLLPEAFLCLVMPLFFIDAPHNGGLGLSPQEFGLTYGTIGIVAIYIGNAIGAHLLCHFRQTYCLVAMSMMLVIHGLSQLYLSYSLGASLVIVSLVTFIGNTGFGIGITTFASAIDRFATARGSVLRVSIAKAMTSLTIILVGIFSGLLQTSIGYRQYFTIVTGLYLVTIAIAIIYASFLPAESDGKETCQQN